MVKTKRVEVTVAAGDVKILADMVEKGGFNIADPVSDLASIAFSGYIHSMVSDKDFRDDMLIRMEHKKS